MTTSALRFSRLLSAATQQVAALALIISLAPISLLANQPPRLSAREATVLGVLDGDTIEVQFPDGTTATVQLLGIETPELAGAGAPAEPFAEEARAFTEEHVGGRDVRLIADTEAGDIDSDGRLLRYVVVDDFHVNAALLMTGLATVIWRYPYIQRQSFALEEAGARVFGYGIWQKR